MDGKLMKRNAGFTIVELLIVIVVIGILAAITIVAFNGVQNRANNTAVQSDLRGMAMKLKEYRILNGTYPRGTTTSSALTGIDPFTVTKNAYTNEVHNLYYCRGFVGGEEKFALVAVSKSGAKYMYDSAAGLADFTAAIGSSGAACNGTIAPQTSTDYSYSYGLFAGTNTWSGWIK